MLARVSKCPRRDRQPHTAQIPETLTVGAIKHIEQQIATHGYRPLPYLGIANRFYQCRDCFDMKEAGSAFEKVAEDRVCGIYHATPIWKPYPCSGARLGAKL
jgi:hypothetical protein